MVNNMIPYARQSISADDIAAVVDVLESDFLTQGPLVPRFETALSLYCGAYYGVAVNSATSALHIACLSLGLGPGDWVWTSPNTFVASANCALYCGASVDFVDIDFQTYNLSVPSLAEKLERAQREGLLPKIVIPVHFAGQPCDMEAIHRLSQIYQFRIIEDASHALGSSFRENKTGSCAYSDITVFSFHPVKMITTGEGGMAMTNSEDLATRMQRLRSHGITHEPQLMETRTKQQIWNYQQIELGFNFRMTDIQAALGLSQLERLDYYVDLRHQIAKRYNTMLFPLELTIPWQSHDAYSSYHLYPIRIPMLGHTISQLSLYTFLRDHGIMVNLHYIPVYLQPFYQRMGFIEGYCPQAEAYFEEALSLPMYPSLTLHQQQTIVDILSEHLVPSQAS